MHTQDFNREPNVRWAERPQRVAMFRDCLNQECNLGDSSAYEARAIRFGVVELGQSTMHLRDRDLVPVLEHLRAFVRDGVEPPKIDFLDWNERQCLLRPGDGQTIQIGVTWTLPINIDDWSLRRVHSSIMTLSRKHLDLLLPNINSFIAHGSIRPDLVEEWFGADIKREF